MDIKNRYKSIFLAVSKWLGLCLLMGLAGGVLGFLFAKCITFVTGVRTEYAWLIYLLPLGGLASAGIYKLLKTSGMGTNHVLKSTYGENELSPLLAPAVFIASALSHLFGASVGREGAALQLGGSLAAFMRNIFHLNDDDSNILTQCGMAALFSAVFGTPLAAFGFCA